MASARASISSARPSQSPNVIGTVANLAAAAVSSSAAVQRSVQKPSTTPERTITDKTNKIGKARGMARTLAALLRLHVVVIEVLIRRIIVFSPHPAHDGPDRSDPDHTQALAGGVHILHPADIAQDREKDNIRVPAKQKRINDRQNWRGIDQDEVEVRPQLLEGRSGMRLGEGSGRLAIP